VKFTDLSTFTNHLRQSSPDHLSQFYAICLPHSYERKRLMLQCSEGLGETAPLTENAYQELFSPSLFNEKRVFLIDELDELNQSELTRLQTALSELASSQSVILGSKKPLSLHSEMKKELITLDLSVEKPWDRKKRIINSLSELVKSQNKRMDMQCLQQLCSAVGDDLERLENEIKKLICFAGEKQWIDASDLAQLSSPSSQINTWQLAEEIIWEKKVKLAEFRTLTSDMGALLPFIGQLRYQLQTGLEMASYLEKGISLGNMQQYFPKVRPKTFDKYLSCASRLSSSYFSKALQELFTLELGLKNRSVKPEILADLFLAKLERIS